MGYQSTVVTSVVQSKEPTRQLVAVFDNDAAAERAVDYLAEQRFEVNRVAIVARNPELVDHVAGRLNLESSALRGASVVGLTGALIGWTFGLLNCVNPLIAGLVLACYGLIMGANIGAFVGPLVSALQHRDHDFSAVPPLQPRHYDLVTDCVAANGALRLLDSVSTGRNGQWQQR